MAMAGDPRLKGIPAGPLAVLLVMAANARDDAEGRDVALVYFRGWHHLAAVLGYPDYDQRAHRAVARHLADLGSRGLVQPVARRGARGNRVYRLHLWVRPASQA